MALDVSTGQFVLRPGPDASENALKFGQIYQQRAMANERLRLAQEAKKNQVGGMLKDYLNPQHYLSGDENDPVVSTKLQGLMNMGSQMAEKGQDFPAIQQALGPGVAELNQYQGKAKLIKENINKGMLRLGLHSGFDLERTPQVAAMLAHHDHNDETGQFGDLKQIGNVDPGKDYVAEAIRLHPELTTSGKGIQQMMKEIPQREDTDEATTMFGGRTKKTQYSYKKPDWMDLKKDANGNVMADKNGNPVGLDVHGETVIGDDNKPMIDPDTKQPFQVLPKTDYNRIIGDHTDVYHYLRGQVKTYFQHSLKPGQSMPSEESPQWDLMARHILRGDLQHEDNSHFKVLADRKENAQASKMDMGQSYFDFMQRQAEASTFGHAKGKAEAGEAGYVTNPKDNTIDVLHHIAQNDPEYLHGETSEQEGRAVMDVTNMLPKGKLKYGPGTNDTYKNVFYDPLFHTYLLKKKDGTFEPPVGLSDLPKLMYKVANPSGVAGGPTAVDKSLKKYGYENGSYKTMAEGPDLTQSAITQKAAVVKQGLDDFEETGKSKGLKDLHTPDGTVVNIETRNAFQRNTMWDKYKINLKKPDGSLTNKTFNTRSEMEDYLKQTTLNNSDEAPKTGPQQVADPKEAARILQENLKQ